jgi:hypothetical protein
MALLNKLKISGTPLSYTNGKTVNQPTAQGQFAPGFAVFNNQGSELHFEYSINDTPYIKAKPAPSQLDLNGIEPKTALKANGVPSINNTFSKGKYEDYVLQTKQFQDRVDDITG